MNEYTKEELDADRAAMMAGDDCIEAAHAEITALCAAFVKLAQKLRSTDASNARSRERLLSACFFAADAIHAKQREWMLKGFDVFVAHDRNGSPIRVDSVCKRPIIGF